MSPEPVSERPSGQAADEAAASNPPKTAPFKRPVSAAVALPSMTRLEAPVPTLLFNDAADDALVCDPNDPDCEIP